MASNSNAQFAFPIEYVSDIQAARQFFVNVLRLEVDREAPTFIQFKGRDGASYAIASDEPMQPGVTPELWWAVADAEAALKDMASKGEISMPLRQMPFGKYFGIKDPAGQMHYVLEFATVRPSQQVS